LGERYWIDELGTIVRIGVLSCGYTRFCFRFKNLRRDHCLGWCGGLALRTRTSKRRCFGALCFNIVLIWGVGVVVFGWLLGRSAGCLHGLDPEPAWWGNHYLPFMAASLQVRHSFLFLSFQTAGVGVSFASLLSLPLPYSSYYSAGQAYRLQDQPTVLSVHSEIGAHCINTLVG